MYNDEKQNLKTSISTSYIEQFNDYTTIANENFNTVEFEKIYSNIFKNKNEDNMSGEINNNILYNLNNSQENCINSSKIEKESKNNENITKNSESSQNNSNKFKKKFFNIIKRGRSRKGIDNQNIKHKKSSKDNCYKKAINISIKKVVLELNSIIKSKYKKRIKKIKRITQVEKGYDKNLLEKTINEILTGYKIFRSKNKQNENEVIIKKIEKIEEIKNILQMKFHCYIDKTMKEELKKFTDVEEKKTCEDILKNGILNFCESIKKNPNTKNK